MLVVEAAGHHGGHSVVDHGQHLHIHTLQRQFRSDKPYGERLKQLRVMTILVQSRFSNFTGLKIKDSIRCILYPCSVNSLSESLDHVFTQKASDTEVLTPVYQ